MAWDEPFMCRECGKMIVFRRSHKGGMVPCNSFSVKIVPDKGGKLYYLGEGKVMWGRKTDDNDPGGVTAWESHYAVCPKQERSERKRSRKTAAQITAAREAAEAQRRRVEAALLAQREKEWAAAQY